jgi:hypothetical protein
MTVAAVLPGKCIRLVDARVICEPGVTGSIWRLHYMIDLSTLRCEQAEVTLPKEGESLTHFTVQPGDVLRPIAVWRIAAAFATSRITAAMWSCA